MRWSLLIYSAGETKVLFSRTAGIYSKLGNIPKQQVRSGGEVAFSGENNLVLLFYVLVFLAMRLVGFQLPEQGLNLNPCVGR